MNQAQDLKQLLQRIDHRGYPAYKDTKGQYAFPGYILDICHVQGDPFASPSRIRLLIAGENAGFPKELFCNKHKKTALEDELLRGFAKALREYSFTARGSGKSGLMDISSCGQEVLERTACNINAKTGDIVIWLHIGFPANGRSINAGELIKILFQFLPDCVSKTLYYKALDRDKLEKTAHLSEDRHAIKEQMKEQDLVVFIGNGSILPRESGISQKPMKHAIPFVSPASLEVTMKLPYKGTLKGMGIKEGITMIAGGGYHGKSTLLEAIERGIYPHIQGDGREYVVTDDTAVKIRAEDGRSIKNVDVSMFIRNLPNGKDTVCFSTENASGSTSQASNVVEAIEAGSRLLLIDEDTCATNFMIRDELMQLVVSKDKEPITPFIDRVRELYDRERISTILVAGSSGAFFHKADCIIQMDCYKPVEITGRAKEAAKAYPINQEGQRTKADEFRIPDFVRKVLFDKKYGPQERVKQKTMGVDSVMLQKEVIDLRYVEQLVDTEQLNSLGIAYIYAMRHIFDGKKTLREALDLLYDQIKSKGLNSVSEGSYLPMDMALPRKQEMFAFCNRCRGIRIQ